VIDFRVSVEVGLVRIHPGDIVYGDLDGVCVIPRDAEADIVQAALEKVRGENLVRKALESGMSAVEAFQTFGIM
jgi:regulator of RNase E activity RraA